MDTDSGGFLLQDSCRIMSRLSGLGGHWSHAGKPLIKLLQCQLALQAVTFFAIPNSSVEWRQQVKRDVRRLEVFWVGVGDVMRQ